MLKTKVNHFSPMCHAIEHVQLNFQFQLIHFWKKQKKQNSNISHYGINILFIHNKISYSFVYRPMANWLIKPVVYSYILINANKNLSKQNSIMSSELLRPLMYFKLSHILAYNISYRLWNQAFFKLSYSFGLLA